MNKIIFYSYFLLHFLFSNVPLLRSQNLVANPSFEQFNTVPHGFIKSSKEFNLPDWNSPTRGTPDYYNATFFGNFNIPRNWAGISRPHEGKAYTGIYGGSVYNPLKKTYREYLQGKLLHPLAAGKLYDIEFYFRLSSGSPYSGDRIGLALVDSAINTTNSEELVITPTIEVVRPPLDAGNWEVAKGLYKAHGRESYLIIGNFLNDLDTEGVPLDYKEGRSRELRESAYYYIDDVKIIEVVVEQPVKLPSEALTRKNILYLLHNLPFDFDSYSIKENSYDELNLIVKVLRAHANWNIEISGHTDDQGTEKYNDHLSLDRATTVATFLKSKGVDRQRIIIRTFGKNAPLQNGTDEKSRAINRRVEVKFVE